MKIRFFALAAMSLLAIPASAGAQVVTPEVVNPTVVTPHAVTSTPAPSPPPAAAPAASPAAASQATVEPSRSAVTTQSPAPARHPVSDSRGQSADNSRSADSDSGGVSGSGGGTLLRGYYENVVLPAFRFSDTLNFLPGRTDLLAQAIAKVTIIGELLTAEAQREREQNCQCTLPPDAPSGDPSPPSPIEPPSSPEEPGSDDGPIGGSRPLDDEPPQAEE